MSWEVFKVLDKYVQVIPLDDLALHSKIMIIEKDGRDRIIQSNCPCHPRFIFTRGSTIIVHNSFDGRELMEQIDSLLSQ